MHLSMHNWMRAEPIDVTVRRLARFGYKSIELSGEPELYNTHDVRKLLSQHGLTCWGVVSLMIEGRDLIDADGKCTRQLHTILESLHHHGEGARRASR